MAQKATTRTEAPTDFRFPSVRTLLLDHQRERPARASVVGRMLGLLESSRALDKSHCEPGHFTVSAFVLCPERRRLLLIHHAKLGRWLQPGGHVEPGDADVVATSRREATEETSVALNAPVPGVFDVDIHSIPARGDLGAHEHFDLRFLFFAEGERLRASPEVRDARWVPLEEVASYNDEESIARPLRWLEADPRGACCIGPPAR